MKSIDDQINAMAALYPNLSSSRDTSGAAIWRGRLQPYRKSYLIEIYYAPPLIPQLFSIIDVQPLVQVLDPVLERHPSYEEGPLPHIYENRSDPALPFLCLFDPDVPEWTLNDLIAETTLPWTERWLLNYEFWLATGLWRGGGRHPTNDDEEKAATRPDQDKLEGAA